LHRCVAPLDQRPIQSQCGFDEDAPSSTLIWAMLRRRAKTLRRRDQRPRQSNQNDTSERAETHLVTAPTLQPNRTVRTTDSSRSTSGPRMPRGDARETYANLTRLRTLTRAMFDSGHVRKGQRSTRGIIPAYPIRRSAASHTGSAPDSESARTLSLPPQQQRPRRSRNQRRQKDRDLRCGEIGFRRKRLVCDEQRHRESDTAQRPCAE
jgi:hypothetical protein